MAWANTVRVGGILTKIHFTSGLLQSFIAVEVNYQTLSNLFEPFQITFEGITGSKSTGDIAIDDFSLTEGACPPSKYFTIKGDLHVCFKSINV